MLPHLLDGHPGPIGGAFYIVAGLLFCYWLYGEKNLAVYICERCGEYKDGDWDVCVEHPTDPTALLCEECALEMEENGDELTRHKSLDNSE